MTVIKPFSEKELFEARKFFYSQNWKKTRAIYEKLLKDLNSEIMANREEDKFLEFGMSDLLFLSIQEGKRFKVRIPEFLHPEIDAATDETTKILKFHIPSQDEKKYSLNDSRRYLRDIFLYFL